MSDTTNPADALAKALYEQIEWGGCAGASWDRAGSGIRAHWTQAAERLLASDWLAARDRRVRAEAWEEGYRNGVCDEATSQDWTGGAVPPARANPYRNEADA